MVHGEMKKPVVLVGLGMLLAFVIMAGVVGFSSMVFADRGVVLVNDSDIDVSLSELESTPEARTPTPTPAETGEDHSAQPRVTATPQMPQSESLDAARTPATPLRIATQMFDQPREDIGTEIQDAGHVVDRRDESYRAQLLRAYDLVATVRPRVNRPIRRRVASPTPASIIGPAPAQDADATPGVIKTATLAPLPDAATPQPPAQPDKPEPGQPQPTAQPIQPPAPKPTEDHHDDDHKPEPTEAPEVHPIEKPEPTETHH